MHGGKLNSQRWCTRLRAEEAESLGTLVERLAQTQVALREAGTLETVPSFEGHIELLAAAQRALVASAERSQEQSDLMALLESAPDFILHIDLQGKILFSNKPLPPLDERELVRADWLSLFACHQPEAMLRAFARTVAHGEVASQEGQGRGPAGTSACYSARLGPIQRDGRIIGVAATIREVTDHRTLEGMSAEPDPLPDGGDLSSAAREPLMQREEHTRSFDYTTQLAAANEELDQFAYSISHDLRGPLRAIAGFSRVLVEDHGAGLNADGLSILDRVVKNTERMGRMIDGLLDFSRLSRNLPALAPVCMQALAENVIASACGMERERELDVSVGELPVADGDEALLRRVWENLISNALKYTRQRDVARIRVRAHEEGGKVIYCVQDNGAGFDMRYADRLFGVFQRLHSHSEFEGSGVGLSIVRRVVTRHGGRVWAEARVGAGASFYFSLPKPSMRPPQRPRGCVGAADLPSGG